MVDRDQQLTGRRHRPGPHEVGSCDARVGLLHGLKVDRHQSAALPVRLACLDRGAWVTTAPFPADLRRRARHDGVVGARLSPVLPRPTVRLDRFLGGMD